MNPKTPTKILFILSIIGIFTLLIISQNETQITQGKIKSIAYSNNKISIYLQNNQTEIVIFTNEILNLQKNQQIAIYGKSEIYKNKKQIIVDKILTR